MPQSLYIILWLVAILWINVYLIQWFRVIAFFNSQEIPRVRIPEETLEIICVFRNEETQLIPFLNQVAEILQNISAKVTLVNDHSEDNGIDIIQKHPLNPHPQFQLLTAPSNIKGKKACINWAVNQSNRTLIFITDADCLIFPLAIEKMFSLMESTKSQLVLGLVRFEEKETTLGTYQSIENSALIALSTYHANMKTPTMGNAANMLFSRSHFIASNPYEQNEHIPGGDDIFLIQAFQNQKLKISYANDINTAVTTGVCPDWTSLWHQRIRWAQKSRFQKTGNTQKSQIVFVLFVCYLWGISIGSVLHQAYAIVLMCWTLKIGGEAIFIRKLFFKMDQKAPSLFQIIKSSLIQSLFVPLVALFQFFAPVYWKGRKL